MLERKEFFLRARCSRLLSKEISEGIVPSWPTTSIPSTRVVILSFVHVVLTAGAPNPWQLEDLPQYEEENCTEAFNTASAYRSKTKSLFSMQRYSDNPSFERALAAFPW